MRYNKKTIFQKRGRTAVLIDIALGNNKLTNIQKHTTKTSWDNIIRKEFARLELIPTKSNIKCKKTFRHTKGMHLMTYAFSWNSFFEYLFSLVNSDVATISKKTFVKRTNLKKAGTKFTVTNELYDSIEELDKGVNHTAKILSKQKNQPIKNGIIDRTDYQVKLQRLLDAQSLYPNHFDLLKNPALGTLNASNAVFTPFVAEQFETIIEAISNSSLLLDELKKMFIDYFTYLINSNNINQKSNLDEIIRSFVYGIGESFISTQYVKYKYPFPKSKSPKIDIILRARHLELCQTFHDFVSLCEKYASAVQNSNQVGLNKPFTEIGKTIFEEHNKIIANPYVFLKEKINFKIRANKIAP